MRDNINHKNKLKNINNSNLSFGVANMSSNP